ncbi:uncharacterized protein LOC116030518 [Ipomoea triloba]|uniref:uncharacterized protein LOC116030518 n=1 Tax=Ipomoea triloba TaxID=35885 RepID=UPI00125E7DB6|nr:uncharacterized protein LOC116030518 [Ipomoea triloba]
MADPNDSINSLEHTISDAATGSTISSTLRGLLSSAHHSTIVYLLVYMDDILVMGNNQTVLDDLLSKLSIAFKIRDLGELGFFLGIETIKCADGLMLSQRRYMNDILKRAGIADCKPLATPLSILSPSSVSSDLYDDVIRYRSLASALQYLTVTRPDLSFAGTLSMGLRLRKSASTKLHAFSDSDWAGCPEDRKSISGYVVFLGTNLVS